jgi:hypothetical protein
LTSGGGIYIGVFVFETVEERMLTQRYAPDHDKRYEEEQQPPVPIDNLLRLPI